MIKRVLKKIYQYTFKCIRRDCLFEEKTEFDPSCIFGGHNYISYGSYLRNTELGYGTYTGCNCFLSSTRIGKYTSIGPFVRTYIGRHPTEKFVSIHPAFFSSKPACGISYVERQKFEEIKFAFNDGNKKYAVDIGNDVWIGAGVCILDGVTIGDGAIIGANSLVNKDIEPYSIVVGTPAKEIKKRFSNSNIKNLLNIKWWNKEESWIKQKANYFEDIENFLYHCMDD